MQQFVTSRTQVRMVMLTVDCVYTNLSCWGCVTDGQQVLVLNASLTASTPLLHYPIVSNNYIISSIQFYRWVKLVYCSL